ncbi:thiopeptide-type bacteriocin biosynthesis protein [Enterococcus casseliflavus]|uniref:thiopeptide-type bacteriocin biosynthesis protein n=1 Tax=Enterococcus casseliflavus TaxID=37734 RepID=UPI0022E0E0DF|nr:thiopeptide-type bacteriocin biosynthesis protein [Enterococcus casseliflavus]
MIFLKNYSARKPLLNNDVSNDIYFINKLEDILCYFDNEKIRTSIYIANKNLFNALIKIDSLTTKKQRSALESFLNYLLRIKSKATPFGLFSAIGVINMASKEVLTEEKTVVSINSESINHLIEKLERDLNLLKYLKVRTNPLFLVRGQTNAYYHNIREGKLTVLNKDLFLTTVLSLLTENEINSIELFDLLIKEFPELRIEDLLPFIYELICNKIIYTELSVSINELRPVSKLKQIVMRIECITNIKKYDRICDLQDEYIFKEFPTIEAIKLLEKHVSAIFFNFGCEFKGFTFNCVTDKVKPLNKKSIDQDIRHALKIFNTFSNKSRFLPFSEEVVQMFREDNEYNLVPLLEFVYDSKINSLLSEDKGSEWKNDFLLDLQIFILQEISKGKQTIDITKIVDSIYTKNIKDDISGELLFYKAKNKIIIEEGYGSNAIGRMNGRFIHYLPKEHKDDYVNNLSHIEGNEDKIINCEVSYFPEDEKIGNIMRSINPYSHEISLNNYYTDKKENISINDIYVGYRKDGFFLWSKERNSYVIPHLSNAVALSSKFPDVFKFLVRVGLSNTIPLSGLGLDSDLLQYFSPEIKSKNVILQRRKWALDTLFKREYESTKNFVKCFEKWKKRWSLPDLVGICFGEAPIIYNLSNKLHLNNLEKIYNSGRNIKFIDMSRHIEGNEFMDFHQYVVSFKGNKSEIYAKKPLCEYVSRVSHSDHNDDGWIQIYFEINNFFYEDFKRILFAYMNKIKNKWYFVNYKTHMEQELRLRIKDVDVNIFSELKTIIFTTLQLSYLSNYKISSVVQEYGRYGGKETFELFTDVFHQSSLVALYYERSRLANKTYLYALPSLYELLQVHEFSDDEIINMFKNYIKDFPGFYQKQKQEIFKTFNNYECFFKKNDERNYFLKKIEEVKKQSIGLSLSHMHINRIIGINKDKEEEIYSLLANYLKEKKYRL